MNNSLTAALEELMKIKGVNAVALVSRDGFIIDSTQSAEIDMEALGAMVATAVGTAESLGREFSFGEMSQYLSEFGTGKILMATALDDVLAVFTDESAVIGGVRFAIKKNLPHVIKAME